MRRINDELRKYHIKPNSYTNINNVIIVDSIDGKYVIKKNSFNNVFEYLKSRNYLYYPMILNDSKDEYTITKYLNSININNEQKIDDIVDLISLLHNKTTHFKEIDSDEYHELYDDINNNISYLYEYYNDLMNLIESKIYMSPSEYLLARNISKIYYHLDMTKKILEEWYSLIKDKKKKRLVVLHNNLRLDHYIYDDGPYLISWDKSRIDLPIFDLYKLYKNEGDKFNYTEVLKRYEKDYPLLEEERILLFILLLLPPKIEFMNNEVSMCVKINEYLKEMDKTNEFISPYYFKDSKDN